jgi:uncharacterized protein YmfQ (DUF2313 family)
MANDGWVPHSADDYLQAFNRLLPQGLAWNRDIDSVQQQLWTGLNDYWGDVDANAALLLTIESDPRQTLQLLPDWEHAWGLPDPCVAEPMSVDARRTALLTKMTMLGGQSRQFFLDVATALGYTITITEYAPYMCGISRCGDTTIEDQAAGGDGYHYRWELGPPESRFVWTIHVSAVRYSQFICGASECGIDRLLSFALATDLECVFRRYKPAHTEIVFDYSQLGSLDFSDASHSQYLCLEMV